MKKTGRTAGSVLLALIVSAACSGCFGGAKKQETESAVADGVLTVGIIDGGDAFARSRDGILDGFEPSIMERLGKKLGVSVEYRKAADVEELMNMLDAGEADIAAGRLTLAETYSESHLATRNYAKSGVYLITKKDRYVDSLAGYEEGTVGISWLIPSFAVTDIPYLGNLQQEVYSDVSLIPADIASGSVVAAVCTERETAKLLEAGASVQAAEIRSGLRLETVFYLAPGQDELAAQANAVINEWLDVQAGMPESEEGE